MATQVLWFFLIHVHVDWAGVEAGVAVTAAEGVHCVPRVVGC